MMPVLLIVFMITAPMLAATGCASTCRRRSRRKPVDQRSRSSSRCRRTGKLFLGRDEVALGPIAAAVRAKLGADRDRAIHLRGDREAAYGEMVAVMGQLSASGFAKVALITNARRAGATAPAQPLHRTEPRGSVAAHIRSLAVQPHWLRPAAVAAVIGLHAAVLFVVPWPGQEAVVTAPLAVVVVPQGAPMSSMETPPDPYRGCRGAPDVHRVGGQRRGRSRRDGGAHRADARAARRGHRDKARRDRRCASTGSRCARGHAAEPRRAHRPQGAARDPSGANRRARRSQRGEGGRNVSQDSPQQSTMPLNAAAEIASIDAQESKPPKTIMAASPQADQAAPVKPDQQAAPVAERTGPVQQAMRTEPNQAMVRDRPTVAILRSPTTRSPRRKKRRRSPRRTPWRRRAASASSPSRPSPNAGVAGSAASSTYRALVMAELNRRKFYPPGAREHGVVFVTFSVSSSGRVSSSHISRSSGVSALDGAVLQMMRSVSLPPPPDGSLSGTAPIRFAPPN